MPRLDPHAITDLSTTAIVLIGVCLVIALAVLAHWVSGGYRDRH